MIAHIQGILVSRSSDACVVEAGGVGYEIHLSQPALASLPPLREAVLLHTHHHVREDAQTLYGFRSADEKQVFLLLMTVKGVGPKVALGILSQMGPAALVSALMKRDLAGLTSLPGVGKKLAERLAVELSDKARQLGLAPSAGKGRGTQNAVFEDQGPFSQAVAALQALGYPSQQAKNAVEKAYQALGTDSNRVEDIVKSALKFI